MVGGQKRGAVQSLDKAGQMCFSAASQHALWVPPSPSGQIHVQPCNPASFQPRMSISLVCQVGVGKEKREGERGRGAENCGSVGGNCLKSIPSISSGHSSSLAKVHQILEVGDE